MLPVYPNNVCLEIWRNEDMLAAAQLPISVIPGKQFYLVIYRWLWCSCSVFIYDKITFGSYILVSEMKYNICCCHIRLSECKVKVHAFLGQNNSRKFTDLIYVQFTNIGGWITVVYFNCISLSGYFFCWKNLLHFLELRLFCHGV